MKQINNTSDINTNKMRSEGNELIPNKYKLHLPLTATQVDRLRFLWDLGYRKVSKEILDEINFSHVYPVALTSAGADYGEFVLSKTMAEQDFALIKIEDVAAPTEEPNKEEPTPKPDKKTKSKKTKKTKKAKTKSKKTKKN